MRLLKTLEQQTELSQRELAERLGVSLGRTNHLVRSLIEKGLVKVDNFIRSNRKLGYLYALTPAYLQRKESEDVALRLEIDGLLAELDRVPEQLDRAP